MPAEKLYFIMFFLGGEHGEIVYWIKWSIHIFWEAALLVTSGILVVCLSAHPCIAHIPCIIQYTQWHSQDALVLVGLIKSLLLFAVNQNKLQMRMTNHVRGHDSFEGSDIDMESNKVRKARVIYLHLCHVMYVMSGNQLSQWSIFVMGSGPEGDEVL